MIDLTATLKRLPLPLLAVGAAIYDRLGNVVAMAASHDAAAAIAAFANYGRSLPEVEEKLG